MYTSKDFKVGDQVSFTYDSGSRPGAIRLVDVKEVYPTYFRGFDHYRKDVRTFSYTSVRNLDYKYREPRGNCIKYYNIAGRVYDIQIKFADNSLLTIKCNDDTIKMNGVILASIKDLELVS